MQQNELLFGVHALNECLKAKKRKVHSIYTTKPEPKGWQRIKQNLPRSIASIQYVSKSVLTRMAGTPDHMGLVAYVSPFVYAQEPLSVDKHARVVLLDGVVDVRNMGAILRSAYCTNMDAVIITKKGCAPISAATIKASAGLAEHLPVYLVPSLKNAVHELKVMGYHFYMTVASGGKNAARIAYKTPLCLVIGSEEKGIDATIRKEGELVTLPQKDTSSYNASVAAGIFMFLISYNKS